MFETDSSLEAQVRCLYTHLNDAISRYVRTWTDHYLQIFRAARDNAHKTTEEAKLLFYNKSLRDLHESDKIWKELNNLGLCSSGIDFLCIFTTEDLNSHFSSISFDPSAPSVSNFLEGVADKDFFPHFSLR